MPPACRPPSIYAKVKRYFDDNPEEELTYQILMDKFNITRRVAFKVVYQLADDGLLEHVHVIRLRAKGIAKETCDV